MGLTITDLLTVSTAAQFEAGIYSVLSTIGFSATSWRPGGIARTIITAMAQTLAQLNALLLVVVESGFLDFASGVSLQMLAKQVFNVDKNLATFATGQETLTNAGGGVYTFAAFAFKVLNPTTNQVYTNVVGFTLAPFSSLTINIQAITIGSIATSAAGTITQLQTPLNGVTCTNAAAVVGQDDETDDELRSRCRAKLGSLSPNGPAAAYDYVARTPALNGNVDVTRTQVIGESSFGNVLVWIANEAGAVPSATVTAVTLGIQQFATPQCITVTVNSATNVSIIVTIDVYILASKNLDNATVQSLITNALITYLEASPIGGFKLAPGNGKIFLNALIGVIESADPLIETIVTAPPGDVTLGDGQVAIPGAFTIAVHQVSG